MTRAIEQVGELIMGRYELLEELGRGGFGVVYRARQTQTGQDVAIKRIRQNLSELDHKRFEAELRVLAQLSHPNLVQLLDGEVSEHGVTLVLEYVQGKTLGQWLRDAGPMSPKLVKRLACQVLEALHTAHDQGIVHRDIKPANLMITGKATHPVAKLLDFGIATTSEVYEGEWQTMTAYGMVPGTPSYLAPELLISDPHTGRQNRATIRSDLYAMGLVMAEMLTGERLMQGNTPAEVCMRQLQHAIPFPQELLCSPYGPILVRACHKNAAMRHVDAGELLHELEALEPLSAKPLFESSEQVKRLLALQLTPVTPDLSAPMLSGHHAHPLTADVTQVHVNRVADTVSTLSATSPSAPPSWRLILPGVCLLVLLAGVVCLLLVKDSARPDEAARSMQAPAAPSDRAVAARPSLVMITTAPAGARVLSAAGVMLCAETPCEVAVLAGESMEVELILDAHVAQTQTLSSSRHAVHVALNALTRREEAPRLEDPLAKSDAHETTPRPTSRTRPAISPRTPPEVVNEPTAAPVRRVVPLPDFTEPEVKPSRVVPLID